MIDAETEYTYPHDVAFGLHTIIYLENKGTANLHHKGLS